MAFDNTNTAAHTAQTPARPDWGVRFGGMSDDRRWTPTPEAQAAAWDAHLKAKARQEAELAAMIAARKGGV